jgi:hypothetical protein
MSRTASAQPARAPARSGGVARPKPGAREWQILAVVLVGAFIAVLDTTIVNVALPSIALGLQARRMSAQQIREALVCQGRAGRGDRICGAVG